MSLRGKEHDYQVSATKAVIRSLKSDPNAAPICVIPTGGGKSLVMAMITDSAISGRRSMAKGRVLLLAHRVELVRQNAEEVADYCDAKRLKLSVYHAGLDGNAEISEAFGGCRNLDPKSNVICAGIQSAFSKAEEIGFVDLIVIDEAHLVDDSKDGSMYMELIGGLKKINPGLRCAGVTATPYRTNSGLICGEDRLFTHVCFSISVAELVARGILCPLKNRHGRNSVDPEAENWKTVDGDFKKQDMDKALLLESKVESAVSEIVEASRGRKRVLVFCCSISHADAVAKKIRDKTKAKCAVVNSKSTTDDERAKIVDEFCGGRIKFLVNVDIFTTGFNCKAVDVVAILRPTNSALLFAQMCGRGMRKHADKMDCIVLDFGENVRRHGALDSEDYGLLEGCGSGFGGSGGEGAIATRSPDHSYWSSSDPLLSKEFGKPMCVESVSATAFGNIIDIKYECLTEQAKQFRSLTAKPKKTWTFYESVDASDAVAFKRFWCGRVGQRWGKDAPMSARSAAAMINSGNTDLPSVVYVTESGDIVSRNDFRPKHSRGRIVLHDGWPNRPSAASARSDVVSATNRSRRSARSTNTRCLAAANRDKKLM